MECRCVGVKEHLPPLNLGLRVRSSRRTPGSEVGSLSFIHYGSSIFVRFLRWAVDGTGGPRSSASAPPGQVSSCISLFVTG